MLSRAEQHLHDGEYGKARRLAEQARDLAIAARLAAEKGGQ